MTKRKRVDEVRWAIVCPSGWVYVFPPGTRRDETYATGDEAVIRVRVTEVPKKKRSKK